jgi:hypothetical protein
MLLRLDATLDGLFSQMKAADSHIQPELGGMLQVC